jgi:periplasmic protein TonB
MKPPMKTRDVQPIYPPDALAAKVQGVVVMEATIDAAGHVRDARVLRGHPQLDKAAVEAVRQWQFEPTMMNGVAVPVIMTVSLNFSVDQ